MIFTKYFVEDEYTSSVKPNADISLAQVAVRNARQQSPRHRVEGSPEMLPGDPSPFRCTGWQSTGGRRRNLTQG